LSKQAIIVGAHYDHVGDDPDGVRYSGANDNASGVSVLLEIARLWQQTGYRPKRTVVFAAWGAQEPGQVGSGYYLANPLWPLGRTMAVIQLDAVGGGRGYFLEAQGDPSREGLLRFTIEASEAWVDGRLTLTRPLGQSDHSPFREAGIPGLLLTWRESSDENLPDELADPVQAYRLGVTGRMLAITLMALAG
jgi:Zn-dependent M28 family amino/carboxypeptidase